MKKIPGIKTIIYSMGLLGIACIIFKFISEEIFASFNKTIVNVLCVAMIFTICSVIDNIVERIKCNLFKLKIDYNNMPDEFLFAYKGACEKYKANLIEERNKIIKWQYDTILTYILLTAFAIGSIIFAINTRNIEHKLCVLILFLILIIMSVFIFLKTDKKKIENVRRYKEDYLQIINNEILKSVELEIECALDKETMRVDSYQLYKNSELENGKFNRYKGNILIANWEKKIFLYNVKVEYENNKRYISDKYKYGYTYKLFNGIFGYLEINKEFDNKVIIRKNDINLLSLKNKIKMDSKEFENLFDVYSKDDILVSNIVSKELMNTFVEFYKKYRLLFEMSFKENRIYIRVFTGPMFKVGILKGFFNKKKLYKDYYVISAIKELIDSVKNQIK